MTKQDKAVEEVLREGYIAFRDIYKAIVKVYEPLQRKVLQDIEYD